MQPGPPWNFVRMSVGGRKEGRTDTLKQKVMHREIIAVDSREMIKCPGEVG